MCFLLLTARTMCLLLSYRRMPLSHTCLDGFAIFRCTNQVLADWGAERAGGLGR
jgi:hypothetical protein